MPNNNLELFVEINDVNFVFVAGEYDDNKNFNLIQKIIIENKSIKKNKFINIEDSIKEIKKNIEIIESKINYVFKNITLILDNFDFFCINVSGYKKLNGSQLIKENISYILNSLKLAVTENENQKTILHIFNSKSILDKMSTDNLPLGLFGDFYIHELTFFLMRNNDLKNIQQIFNQSNLEIKNIILKDFSEGTQLVNQTNIENFIKIKINEDSSSISFFDQASFRYLESFNFGTNVILRDISKICSLDFETISNILTNDHLNLKTDSNEFLDEQYFKKKNFRKIRKKLILDIVDARISELVNIILNKNINFKSFENNNCKIYLTIKDKIISNNFKNKFVYYLTNFSSHDVNLIDVFTLDSSIKNTAFISTFGWRKEAIPVVQKKNSLITRIFRSIFG